MSEPTTPVTGHLEHVDVGEVRPAVRSWGDPADRPLLFWHPLSDLASGAYLSELAPILTDQFGMRLVAVDGPGFRRLAGAAAADYDMDRLADLAWGLVDALQLARPVLMGHSWGGIVLLATASARPSDASALVLLDAGHFAYADLVRQLQEGVRRPLTDRFVAGLRPAVRETADGALVPITSVATRAAAQHELCHEQPLDRWPALAAADLPVLLLLATEPAPRTSHEAGVPAVRSAHPGADVRLMAGWGHDLMADGGPALAQVIGDWVTRHP